jgi:hypothetical protein
MKERISPAINAHLLRGGFYVVLLLAGTLLAFLRPEAPAEVSHRMLTFAERVAYFPAHAATITVTNTNDSGPGSLRQALADANDGDTIDFAVTGTIGLTSSELTIDKSITISGPGPDMLAVSRSSNTQFRIFHVMPGQIVSIQGLTISGGSSADSGGGILNDQATLTLTNCSVVNNVASQEGGGIAGGSLTIINCTISGNSSVAPGFITIGYGGGISGGGTITNSTITGNYSGSVGGGIAFSGTISNCTISYNGAGGGKNYIPGSGGGIAGGGTISNCTISGNWVSGGKGPGLGGGIYAGGGTISNCTFSDNYISYGGNGAGICNAGTLEIGNTILNAEPPENLFNNGGTITSAGYNLSSDDGGGYLNGPGDQINTDPMLGLLQDNGGRTFTHELLSGSPAIDAGNPNFTPPPFYDQRGPDFYRIRNDRIDIGSFEVQEGPAVTPTPTPTPTPTATPTPTPRPSPTPRSRPTPLPRPSSAPPP